MGAIFHWPCIPVKQAPLEAQYGFKVHYRATKRWGKRPA
jgi:hypothetical protein